MNNIYTQMQSIAEEIIPGVDLAVLLRNPEPGTYRDKRNTKKIGALLNSERIYMAPKWLAGYYPVSESTLVNIKKSTRTKRSSITLLSRRRK